VHFSLSLSLTKSGAWMLTPYLSLSYRKWSVDVDTVSLSLSLSLSLFGVLTMKDIFKIPRNQRKSPEKVG
jgi:hypothetical protein